MLLRLAAFSFPNPALALTKPATLEADIALGIVLSPLYGARALFLAY
jgi:hypothetical protein